MDMGKRWNLSTLEKIHETTWWIHPEIRSKSKVW